MKFDVKLLNNEILTLNDTELFECYKYLLGEAKNNNNKKAQAALYLSELNRRYVEKQMKSNRKTNRIMVSCTVAIALMTAVILWATLVGAGIINYGG